MSAFHPKPNTKPGLINLKIFLPSHTFTEKRGLAWVAVETPRGVVVLRHGRPNCVVALRPGILLYKTEEEGALAVALDQGTLIKADADVSVFVRDAVNRSSSDRAKKGAERAFRVLDDREKGIRSILMSMEDGRFPSVVQFSNGHGHRQVLSREKGRLGREADGCAGGLGPVPSLRKSKQARRGDGQERESRKGRQRSRVVREMRGDCHEG